MRENQRVSETTISPLSGSRAVSGCVVQVESIDGDMVRVEVSGSERVSEVRQQALADLGAITGNPDKYVVIGADGRVIDENATIDQLASENRELRFQLLPQAAFGPRAK